MDTLLTHFAYSVDIETYNHPCVKKGLNLTYHSFAPCANILCFCLSHLFLSGLAILAQKGLKPSRLGQARIWH